MKKEFDALKILLIVVLFSLIIITFTRFSHIISLSMSLITVCLLAWLFYNEFQLTLPAIFISACYERPVIDFALGIMGTIKLFDIVVISMTIAFISLKLFKQFKADNLKKMLLPVCLFSLIFFTALISSGYLTYMVDVPFERARVNYYYLVKLFEYLVVYAIISAVSFSEEYIEKSIKIFVFFLSLVSVYGILQGVGLAENSYYSWAKGASHIDIMWSISSLGPNHTHFGIYMFIGIALSSLLFKIDKGAHYLVTMVVCFAGLCFSHSAVSFGMVGIYFFLDTFFGKNKGPVTTVLLSLIFVIMLGLYFSGILGGGQHERTIAKFTSSHGGMEIPIRAFFRPLQVAFAAFMRDPLAFLYGYGYRIADIRFSFIPATGDNNYFSVLMDIGLFGLLFFISFLVVVYLKIKDVLNNTLAGFGLIFTDQIRIVFFTLLIGAFTQEIFWPLHSRGNTMAVLLILVTLPVLSKSEKAVPVERKAPLPYAFPL